MRNILQDDPTKASFMMQRQADFIKVCHILISWMWRQCNRHWLEERYRRIDFDIRYIQFRANTLGKVMNI